MKYIFLAMAYGFGVVFALGLILRMQTGEIVSSYYPSQISMWVTIGVWAILRKLDSK